MVCSLFSIQHTLGKKWTLLIVQALEENKQMTFNELKKQLKRATSKVVTERLNELIQEKIIERKRNNYTLTKKGEELNTIFTELKVWGAKYGIVPEDCPKRNCMVCVLRETCAKRSNKSATN